MLPLRRPLSCLVLLLAGCTPSDTPVVLEEALPADALTAVDFPVGVAVPADPWPNSLLGSPERQAIVSTFFSSITAENAMKMAYLHPAPDRYAFDNADVLVEWARQEGLVVHGHALVWHNQAPDWMNTLEGDREVVETILAEHVAGVAGHFGGRLASWDVVNEAFADSDADGDGLNDLRDTLWLENVGLDYVATAFRVARAADPDADLYYNDYNLSSVPAKLAAVLDMVDAFRSDPDPVPIDGIGFQMHISLAWPEIGQVRAALAAAAATGLKVKISELDITVNTDGNGVSLGQTTLTPAVADQQRARYEAIVRAYLDEVPAPQRGGITVWGIADVDSWRRSYNSNEGPLLFDDAFAAKPALTGFADGLRATP